MGWNINPFPDGHSWADTTQPSDRSCWLVICICGAKKTLKGCIYSVTIGLDVSEQSDLDEIVTVYLSERGYVSLCPRLFVPTSLYAPKSGILCPLLFVPTSLYAQKSGILCPLLFVPTSLYAQKSGILCPRLFVPTSLYAPKSGILCPRLFVPTSLYAQTYDSRSFG